MKKIFITLLMCLSIQVIAEDLSPGQKKADSACSLCHGPLGIATLPNAPNLAGQQAIYLSEQLKNYRSGKRQSEVMNLIAKNLSDIEISQLSAWYSSIKVTAESP
jgi:cytochrome c553